MSNTMSPSRHHPWWMALIVMLMGIEISIASDQPPPPSFEGVTSVIFHGAYPESKIQKIEVRDAKQVKELVAAVKLVPKRPCLCDHLWAVTFVRGKESIRVRISNHSFDITGDNGTSSYRMPPKFYQLFEKHKRQPIQQNKQDGADQPATAVESKTEGKEKPKTESDGRSQ